MIERRFVPSLRRSGQRYQVCREPCTQVAFLLPSPLGVNHEHLGRHACSDLLACLIILKHRSNTSAMHPEIASTRNTLSTDRCAVSGEPAATARARSQRRASASRSANSPRS